MTIVGVQRTIVLGTAASSLNQTLYWGEGG
jgi:hypothetical protein